MRIRKQRACHLLAAFNTFNTEEIQTIPLSPAARKKLTGNKNGYQNAQVIVELAHAGRRREHAAAVRFSTEHLWYGKNNVCTPIHYQPTALFCALSALM